MNFKKTIEKIVDKTKITNIKIKSRKKQDDPFYALKQRWKK